MGGSRSNSDFFFGKSSQNSPMLVLLFWVVYHVYVVSMFTILKVVTHFCNRVVSLWNGLPEHVVTASSLTLFKKYLRTIDFSSYIKFDRNL